MNWLGNYKGRLFLLFVLVGSVGFAFVENTRNLNTYDNFLELLNIQIRQEATLIKEVLVVENSEFSSYNQLNKVHTSVRKGYHDLVDEAVLNDYWSNDDIKLLLTDYEAAISDRGFAIEDLKSELAIFRNSNRYAQSSIDQLVVASDAQSLSNLEKLTHHTIANILTRDLTGKTNDPQFRVTDITAFNVSSDDQKNTHLKGDLKNVIENVRPHILQARSNYENAKLSLDAILRSAAPANTEKLLEIASDLNHALYTQARQLSSVLTFALACLVLSLGFFLFRSGKISAIKLAMAKLETRVAERTEELHIAKEKAIAADHAKSQFLANMSHEVRTPMNGVMGMAELLAKSGLSPKQQSFTDIIIKSGESLLTIINDILDFSKIEAGELEIFPEPFVLADAIEDVAILNSANAVEKGIELVIRIDPNLPRSFVGDAGRIRQVLGNYLTNAIKFTDSGHVLIDVAMRADERNGEQQATIEVKIEDTGIGISPGKLDGVFEKFTQADNSATRAHEGTGLGLSICKSLIQLMGGEVGVESTIGEGSVFWFVITMPVAEIQSDESHLPFFDVSGAKVLIVEDNLINQSILQQQIESFGFDVSVSSNGVDALERLNHAGEQGDRFDIVVLDYNMRGMSGADTAMKIRETQNIADTPIVVLTSIDNARTECSLANIQLDGNLTKPVKASILQEKLIQVLQADKVKTEQKQENECSDTQLKEKTSIVDGQPTELQTAVSNPVLGTENASNDLCNSPVEHSVDESSTGEREHETVDILIAEDNEVNQLVYTQILNSLGYTYEIAANGREAVSMFSDIAPTIIIMDVSMPLMSGHEASRAIRDLEKRESLRKTPIIGITAHAMVGDMEKCFEAGMDDYLTKPISPKRLEGKLSEWIGQAQKNQSTG